MLDKPKQARPGSLESAYDAAITWRYIAPAGHTLDDCMRADYFANNMREVGHQRTPGRHAWNKIEIIAEDGAWEAELRIISAADGLVQTRILREWNDEKRKAEPAPDGYRVEHVANNGWRAFDQAGATVIEKAATRDQALALAKQHASKASGGRK